MPRASTRSDPFNAIAEPRRRHILELLAGEERSVSEIAAALELNQPSTSKHLQVLLEVGLVDVRRDGRNTLYRTNPVSAAHHPRVERAVRAALARAAAAHQDPRRGGPMTTATLAAEPFTINEEIFVRASLEKTFRSLLAQMGRLNETPDGKPLPMILEPFPGGRWYRDLGGENGHLWAFVQSIKRPVLLELWGPLFMSNAATSNLQYRLKEVDGGIADHVPPHDRRTATRRRCTPDGSGLGGAARARPRRGRSRRRGIGRRHADHRCLDRRARTGSQDHGARAGARARGAPGLEAAPEVVLARPAGAARGDGAGQRRRAGRVRRRAVARLRAAGGGLDGRAGAGAGRQRRQGARAPRRFRRHER